MVQTGYPVSQGQTQSMNTSVPVSVDIAVTADQDDEKNW